MISFTVEMPENIALGLHALLHDDGGLRESAAQQLLARHTPADIQAWTEGVAGLGYIAKPLTTLLLGLGLLNTHQREEEARRLAFAHLRALARTERTNSRKGD